MGARLDRILKVEVTIPWAQIATLRTSPVTVVAAPGAGKVIRPIVGMWKFTAGVTPVTFTDPPGYLAFTFADYFATSVQATTSPPLGVDAESLLVGFENVGGLNVDKLSMSDGEAAWNILPATAVNKPLVAMLGANPTAGSGTLFCHVLYEIVTLP